MDRITKQFTVFFALLPFLYQYKSPIPYVSFGEFILIPYILYFVVQKKNHLQINKEAFNGVFLYFLCAIICSIIASVHSYFNYGSFVTVCIRIVFYSLLIWSSYDKMNVKFGLLTVQYASALFAIYALIQFIAYKKGMGYLSTVIRTDWIFVPERGIRLDYERYFKYTFRPSSLFLEPSYYAMFSGVGLTFSLFGNLYKIKDIVIAVIITIGLVVSTSSAGFIIIIICWGMFFYKRILTSSKCINIKHIVLAIGLILIGYMLFTSSLSETLIKRTATGGSFNNRITRGWIIGESLNYFQLLFGVGINNLGNYVIYNDIRTPYDESDLNYTSSLIGTMLSSGLITLFFFLDFYYKAWKNKNNCILSKMLICIIFVLSTFEAISFSYRFVFYTLFIISIQYNNKLEVEIA